MNEDFRKLTQRANAAREKAIMEGKTLYNPRLTCSRGHMSQRYTASGDCETCANEDLKKKKVVASAVVKTETAMQAQRAGRTKYRTGKPCKRGHNSPRYTSNSYCCECQAENARAARERLMGPALVSVTVKVPGNQAQALRDYAQALRDYVDILNTVGD